MNRYLKIDLSRAENIEGNTVPTVISTDTPVERGEYKEWKKEEEIKNSF